MNNEREKLGSRLGFILLSAGCAIGLGNVWTFPWRTGNNGGAAFVLLYILAVIILGIPVMVAEFTIGRASQTSPILMEKKLEKPGTKWHINGWISLAGNLFLMMFYTTIAGYFIHYLIKFLTGNIENLTYAATKENVAANLICNGIIVIVGFIVLSFKLQKGVERITKYMMICLFVLLIAIGIHCCTLPGAKEGLTFYLKPDFSTITAKTVIAAMNQAFFSLSLGMGSMAIFGSYINKDRALLGESISVCGLDTLVALLAGLIIFPACFSFGIQPDAGPDLLFTTMVPVFASMKGGMLWGTLFFLFMLFAAFSTVFAVFENILAMIRDLTGWSRKKGCIICCIAMLVLTLPMALTGNVLSSFHPFSSEASNFLDLWDFFVETIIQPLGSIIFLLFIAIKSKGWGWDNFVKEANIGKGLKIKSWMKPVICYISPAIITFLWIYGLIKFGY